MRRLIPYYIYILCLIPQIGLAQKSMDAELLGKAIEYFGGGKYHEAMLNFEKLKVTYRLNPRFEAYLGVCYYKEEEYEKAAKTLQAVIPSLAPFTPNERATYCFSCAESLFMICQYDSAATYYKKTLPDCRKDDLGDVYFRLGFCALFTEDYDKAIDDFGFANFWFGKTRKTDNETKARKKQTKVMLRSLLVTHGARRMDMTDEITRNNKHQDAGNESGNINENK
ncbi:MAG: tetratricopeptide repeat protein [Prevotella sp.]|nr:tetratricopeptide repeat protein [Prevotella sp.]